MRTYTFDLGYVGDSYTYTVTVTAQSPAPTISVVRNPSPMISGKSYTVTWSTTNASSVYYTCSASGTGFVGSGTLGPNGSVNGTGDPAWVGYPSACTWTATGPGGSKSVSDPLQTDNPAPTINASASCTTSPCYATAAAYLSASASDSNGYVARVEFYRNGSLVFSDTSAPYEYTDTGLSASTYTYTARAYDNEGRSTLSGSSNVTVVVPNTPPNVALTSPAAGSTVNVSNLPYTLNLRATASDTGGSISSVEFRYSLNGTHYSFGNGSLSGGYYVLDTALPTTPGTYYVYAKATDNSGLTTNSSTATVNVTNPSMPAIGSFTVSGVNFTLPTGTSTASLSYAASATDANGQVVKLELLNGSTVIDTVNAATTGGNRTVNLGVGTHTLKIRATDNQGGTTLTAGTNVTVVANNLPAVSLSAPASAVVWQNVTLSASATDSDGTLTKVEFWRGTTKLGEDTTAPYSFDWSTTSAGSYTFTAKAFDNLNGITTSNVVTINVGTSTPAEIAIATTNYIIPAGGTAAVRIDANTGLGMATNVGIQRSSTGANGTYTTVRSSQIEEIVDYDDIVSAGTYWYKAIQWNREDGSQTFPASAPVQVTVSEVGPVIGSVDGIFNNAQGEPILYGWACEKKDERPVSLHLYVNSGWPDGSILAVAEANLAGEAAIATSCGTTRSAFRWNFNLAPFRADHGGSALYVHGLSLNGGANPLLGSSGTFTIPVIPNTAPTATFSLTAAPTQFYVPVGGTVSLGFNAGSADAENNVTKLELFNGANATPLWTLNGSSASNQSVTLAKGTYLLRVRATDAKGLSGNSAEITVTVTERGPVKGNVEGVVIDGQGKASLQGWACDQYDERAIGVKLFVGGPSSSGTFLLNQTANLPGEAALATACGTSNSAFRFSFDLEPYRAAHGGKSIYVQGLSLNGGSHLDIPGSGNYTVPVVSTPVASLNAPNPSNVRVAVGAQAAIRFTGSASVGTGKITKLELFRDTGSGYESTAFFTKTTDAASVTLNELVNLGANAYRIKLRATNNVGQTAESQSRILNITDSPLLGTVDGVRINAEEKPELIGWVCQESQTGVVNVQVHVNAPGILGGTQITTGTANLIEGSDSAAVQAACKTPGTGHRFKIDLSAYTSQYAGAPIYVTGTAVTSSAKIILPCADNTCTMPASLRIALTNPANNDRATAPANLFAKAKLTNVGAGVDEVAIAVDDQWQTAQPDTEANTWYISKPNLSARVAPYWVKARVRQGNTTLYSLENAFYVDGSATTTLNLATPTGSFTAPAIVNLSATVGGDATAVTKVEFLNDQGQVVASGKQAGNTWSANWYGLLAGSHTVTARALNIQGAAIAITSAAGFSVTTATGPSDATPIAVDITPPHLGNPDAGSLPGELSVSPSGAATYSIPIAVPPGVNGMQPALSLNYSSQAGNGVAGLGWSLGGFSSIQRCGKTIAQDGLFDAVRFANTDRLCMDGQRLVLANLVPSDVNYWADNAEYRTEIETFSRITAQLTNGKRSFKVETKGGQTLYFGDSSDSYVAGQGRADEQAYAWALRKSEDLSGNQIQYTYQVDATTGEHLPKTVRWGSAALLFARADFTYESRPDPVKTYLSGSRKDLRSRLTAITMKTDTGVDGSGGVQAQKYVLGYEQSSSSGRSLLDWIKVCDAQNNCLPETQFTWGTEPTGGSQFESAGAWANGPTLEVSENQLQWQKVSYADFNGDGKFDFLAPDGVYLSTGAGFNKIAHAWNAIPAGNSIPDGLPGRVIYGNFDGSDRVSFLDVRVVTTPTKQYWGQLCKVAANSQSVTCGNEFLLGANAGLHKALSIDTDGDGKDELLRVTQAEADERCVVSASGLGCTAFPGVAAIYHRTTVDETIWDESDPWNLYTGPKLPIPQVSLEQAGGDFDGDGITDYLFEDGTLCLTKITGITCQDFAAQLPGWAEFFDGTGQRPTLERDSVIDINGDGYLDFVASLRTADGSSTQFSTCLGTGTGINCQSSSNPLYQARAVDVRGNGQGQWLRKQSTGVVSDELTNSTCTLVDGNTSCAAYPAPAGWSGPTQVVSGGSNLNHEIYGDFDGDGQTDIATYRHGNTIKWEIYRPKTNSGTDRLVSVTNGVGQSSEAIYAKSGDSTTYASQGNNIQGTAITHAYPAVTISVAGTLVKQLDRVDTLGNRLVTQYQYGIAASDQLGRGHLGFAYTIQTDVASGIKQQSWYSQTWPLAGMEVADQTVKASQVLAKQINTLATKTLSQSNGAEIAFPYVDTSQETRYDLDGTDMGTTTTTSVYDARARLSSVVVNVKLGTEEHSATVTNAFKPSALTDAPWLQQLMESVTTTKTNAAGSITREVGYEYEINGLVKKEIIEPNQPALKVTTELDRSNNAFGLVGKKTQTWTDPVTGATKSRVAEEAIYEPKGRFPQTVKNALGQAETRGYDAATGKQTRLVGPNGIETQWVVDGFGQVKKEIRHDDTDSAKYTEVRQYLKQCDTSCPTGATTVVIVDTFKGTQRTSVPSLVYRDSAGHELRKQTYGFDGRAIVVDTRYDSRGRVWEVYQPTFDGTTAKLASRTSYDDLNRVTKVETPSDTGALVATTTAYNGLVTTTTNPKNQVKADTRNVVGQLVETKDALNGITSFGRDAWGNLTKTTDPAGNVIEVVYDLLGRKTELKDPDLGRIEYSVDPLGRVYRQISPKARAAAALKTLQLDKEKEYTRTEYDDLNRMTARYEPNLESHWVYDHATNPSNCATTKSCGQLVEAYTGTSSNKTYSRIHSYDSLGRPDTTTTQLDTVYVSTQSYDSWGRSISRSERRGTDVTKTRKVENRYNGYGYLKHIERNGLKLWEAIKQDAANRVETAQLGNGLIQTREYNEYTGLLNEGLYTNAALQPKMQESYNYDVLGNVSQRTHTWGGTNSTIEDFTYDGLNRLETSTVAGQSTQHFEYNAIGNMTRKTGVGTGLSGSYKYPAQGANAIRPHAVNSIDGVGSFSYDANGNMTSGAGRNISWTSFDMPLCMTKGSIQGDGSCASGASAWSQFVYGPEHQRLKQLKQDGSIVYAGAMEVELDAANAVKRIKTYWPQGLGVEIEEGGNTQLRWTHVDRLGSVVGISDETGNFVEQLGFDAWGKRRNLNGNGTPDSLDGQTDNKGYTGHEMLDALDLVHMNGRVYDPLVARFMSADPLIQDPEHSQSYNRYTYVWNNPTNLTDPTGFVASDSWQRWDQNTSGLIIQKPEDMECSRSGCRSPVGPDGPKWDAAETTNEGGEPSGLEKILINGVKTARDTAAAIESATSGPISFVVPAVYGFGLLASDQLNGGADAAEDILAGRLGYAATGILLRAPGARTVLNKVRRLAKSCDCCFPAGTPVLTADGAVPIEEVTEGQLVYARNEHTGQTALKPVTQLMTTEGKPLFALVTQGKFGRIDRMEVTDNHPYWVQGKGWVAAAKLKPGMVLDSFDQGALRVVTLNALDRVETTYNFTVADYHTYFAGRQRVFVHNNNGCFCINGKKGFPKDFPTKNTKDWSGTFKSEGEARALAREKLGANPVEVEANKWRSADGKWQYRAKPGDVGDNHIHLEELNPQTGEVLQNLHLRWPEGAER
ncbi:Ig-like domain-containing protein [Chitinimonas sp. BJYL2]|uniref:Ig-like domain-containing protein n=1 Tax=Chitinimonas sp. BJYL2 TaxID=2976696 RepID=UPI0022B2F197|nr:Ig-like domain-containing protein [Chitinimonas sp. BJYL2]